MKRCVIVFCALLFAAGSASGQEGFAGEESSLEGFASEESADEGFGTDEGFGPGFGDFGSDAASGSGSNFELEISGEASVNYRAFVQDWENAFSRENGPEPAMILEIAREGENSGLTLRFRLNERTLVEENRYIVDEASLKLYTERADIALGIMSVTWGKGDTLHVLDVINGQSLRDFINPDIGDRKLPAEMVKADIPLGENGKIEGVWVPFLQRNRLAAEGDWVVSEISTAKAGARTLLVTLGLASDAGEADELINKMITEEIEPELGRSQFGLRYTDTAGSVDYGLQYYYGFEKNPIMPSLSLSTTLEDLHLSYERIHLFGGDIAFNLLGFAFRAEGAYTLPENPDANGYWGYAAGFDGPLPSILPDINVQIQGTLFPDSGDDNTHLLVAELSDTYLSEKLKPSIAFAAYLGENDYFLYPSLNWTPVDNLSLKAGCRYFFGDEEGTFGQFNANSYADIQLTYSF